MKREAIISISTLAPKGEPFTAKQDLAGNGVLNCFAYSAFISGKSRISIKNTVHFTTLSRVRQAASSAASKFAKQWLNYCSKLPSINVLVTKSMEGWPERYTVLPPSAAWANGSLQPSQPFAKYVFLITIGSFVIVFFEIYRSPQRVL